jgi:hypothetical protein
MKAIDTLTWGPVIIFGGVWYQREMYFLVKVLLIQPLKGQKKIFTQPQK